MVLDKRQIEAIELLIEGKETKTDIAKRVGVQRKTLYEWFKKTEFVKEWDKRLHELKTQEKKSFDAKLSYAIDELWNIINCDGDIRTREKAIEYWINRSLGTPTNKLENISEGDNKDDNSSALNKLYNVEDED